MNDVALHRSGSGGTSGTTVRQRLRTNKSGEALLKKTNHKHHRSRPSYSVTYLPAKTFFHLTRLRHNIGVKICKCICLTTTNLFLTLTKTSRLQHDVNSGTFVVCSLISEFPHLQFMSLVLSCFPLLFMHLFMYVFSVSVCRLPFYPALALVTTLLITPDQPEVSHLCLTNFLFSPPSSLVC